MSQSTPAAENGVQGASADGTTSPTTADGLQVHPENVGLRVYPQHGDLSGATAATTIAKLGDVGFGDQTGDNAATDDPGPEVPTWKVPALDDIMPPLDRNGKRGALNAEERDYKRRRALLAEVLERMVPAHAELTERLAAAEQERDGLRRDYEELNETATRLTTESGQFSERSRSLGEQVAKLRGTQDRTRKLASISFVASTQFCRLTGMELSSFSLSVYDTVQYTILGHPELRVAILPEKPKLEITLQSGHVTGFDLTDDGQIDPTDAMAILTLLGITRNLREALSAMALQAVFGINPEDTRLERLGRALGGIAMISVVDRTNEFGGAWSPSRFREEFREGY